MSKMKKGRFIVFEGGEGCGKTTQLNLVERYLIENGYNTERIREPGGTKISESIRNVLLDPENTDMGDITELFLYLAARSQLVHQIIRPSLEDGKIVLADRFYYSTIVYQGIGRGIGLESLIEANNLAIQGIKPDYTFILDVP